MVAQVITANRLRDGAVVYLSVEGEWVPSLEAAATGLDAAAAAALALEGERAVADCLIVAPYLIEVETTAQGPRPKRYREQLRAAGPSIAYGAAAN